MPLDQTTFYSDSSSPTTPEDEIPRFVGAASSLWRANAAFKALWHDTANVASILDRPNYPTPSNDARSASDPVSPETTRKERKPAKANMATPVTATANSAAKEVPRNSSLDTAISAIASKQAVNRGTGSSSPTSPAFPDITSLINTAGSPEAVIQHLLKEKQSQAQQNSQLWRLVDKQRAMILGLNKDLEAALKDKEKYRKKLKELMSDPVVVRAMAGQSSTPSREESRESRVVATPPRLDTQVATLVRDGSIPDSPDADSDRSKDSPVNVSSLAPYPITPPADRPPQAASISAHSANVMPIPQRHAAGGFDLAAEEHDAEQQHRVKKEQQREMPYNVFIPPSRSLPSNPPQGPPPQVPTPTVPTGLPASASSPLSPGASKGLAEFPPPPRKAASPKPLQLNRQSLPDSSGIDDESDSDLDDILRVEGLHDDHRGRRMTREYDGQGVSSTASTALARGRLGSESPVDSPSRPSESSGIEFASETLAPSVRVEDYEPASRKKTTPRSLRLDNQTLPVLSPGLPSTPRPMGSQSQLPRAAPLSPRPQMIVGQSGPLSPRPPRQPIPLPPNTPLASEPSSKLDGSPSIAPLNLSRREHSAGQLTSSSSAETGDPMERRKIFKGLITEEYPDLLLPPNALLSVRINVASSRMKPSRASLLSLTQLEEDPVFTLAVISRADNGELWRVEKDTTSLAKLDQRLKQCIEFTAKTPDRSLFSGHAPAKLDARRIALDQYMEELLDTPLDTASAVELCRYLSTNTLPPNADETGSSIHPTPENSGLKIGPDGRPVKTGYLTKKGKNFGGWKARFFVLEGPQLKYYEAPGGAHLGTIKLQNAQIGRQSQHANLEAQSPIRGAAGEELDDQYRHAFLILEPKKKDSSALVKHVLCAESDKERDLWVDVLVQWVDFRDANDSESGAKATSTPDRKVAAPEGTTLTKTKKGSNDKSSHKQTGSDGLIGVRYDSTHAGEAPQLVTSGAKGSGGLSEHGSLHNLGLETMSSQAQKSVISGPKDPQIISDSAAWGNKIGIPAPTNDEKKQRKRSFFGFGPKNRPSSDGQDSLFAGSDNGAPPHPGSAQASLQQVFGAPLAEAVRFHPPTGVNVPLPSVVFRCVQYLESQNAVAEEGIFRLSGSNLVIKQLRERFNVEGDINLVTDEQYYDIHAVASLLKLYLRELPTTILTRDLHLDFLATTEIQDRSEKTARLHELALKLPQANATLLKYLIAFLIKIINNADINKMTARNVGIVFSPTLNIPAQVFAMFMQNYKGIFGIEPEEYELPPVPADADVRSLNEAQSSHARFEPPRRPSTSSGGSASPHRQPRVDSMRDQPRSTPTPPLMSAGPAARGSPTPPLGQTYGQHITSGPRPAAYESAYGIPTGYDGSHHMAPRRASPGYDRPLYASSTSTDERNSGSRTPETQQQGTAVSASRRESSVYIGGPLGLQQQGSRSRLREEARY